MTRFRPFGTALLLWIVTATPAAAQSLGLRAGASVDPDQFYFGGHAETAPLVDQLRFRPNLEIGVGNDVTLVAINVEFAYSLPVSGAGWTLYAGGGPALNVINAANTTHSEGGFNLLLGGSHEGGLFGEIKVGFLDSPNFKIGVGYSFRWR
jgi:hypothetical protein